MTLPDDVLLTIFEACDLPTMLACSLVCRRWRSLCSRDSMWLHMAMDRRYITKWTTSLKEAIDSQNAVLSTYDDCSTWESLFRKRHLSERNWTLNKSVFSSIPVPNIWHVKLDSKRKTFIISEIHGGIKVINWSGNILWQLGPQDTLPTPHVEYDGTYLAFPNGMGSISVDVYRRIKGNDGFEKVHTLHPCRGTVMNLRLKDGYLLAASQDLTSHCNAYLSFWECETGACKLSLPVKAEPHYVDFDETFIYLAAGPVEPLLRIFYRHPLEVPTSTPLETQISTEYLTLAFHGNFSEQYRAETGNSIESHEGVGFSLAAVCVDSVLHGSSIFAVTTEGEVWYSQQLHYVKRLVKGWREQSSEARCPGHVPGTNNCHECQTAKAYMDTKPFDMEPADGIVWEGRLKLFISLHHHLTVAQRQHLLSLMLNAHLTFTDFNMGAVAMYKGRAVIGTDFEREENQVFLIDFNKDRPFQRDLRGLCRDEWDLEIPNSLAMDETVVVSNEGFMGLRIWDFTRVDDKDMDDDSGDADMSAQQSIHDGIYPNSEGSSVVTTPEATELLSAPSGPSESAEGEVKSQMLDGSLAASNAGNVIV